MSPNRKRGIDLLTDLSIDDALKLKNLNQITLCDDLIGIWAQLDVDDIYPFTKVEKEQMKEIRSLLKKDINDEYNLYKAGLYISTVVYQIKKKDITTLNKIYHDLPIKSRKDININGQDISNLLNLRPGIYIKEIMNDIEKKIINHELNNTKEDLNNYIEKHYKKTR